jgi:hypothetical protein
MYSVQDVPPIVVPGFGDVERLAVTVNPRVGLVGLNDIPEMTSSGEMTSGGFVTEGSLKYVTAVMVGIPNEES